MSATGARATIIFGNGLGMALDSEYFVLKNALKTAWNTSGEFKEHHKKLIKTALPEMANIEFPESEEMLDKLQVAITAIETLRDFEKNDISWLNDSSREVPDAFKKYIHEVGLYFHKSNKNLPFDFISQLANFIRKSNSHIGILNYDNLLYDPLCQLKILSGFSGYLIDGFTDKKGFDPSNLDRLQDHLGWFMHLHGSPLFINNHKKTGAARDFLMPTSECHIVLTHVKHKLTLINRSKILSEYWSRLSKAIKESKSIILFGYSGNDLHLNQIISAQGVDKRISIVEWKGNGDFKSRKIFWESSLDLICINLLQLENILEFSEWSKLTGDSIETAIPF